MKGETKQVNERRKMRKSEKGDRRGDESVGWTMAKDVA